MILVVDTNIVFSALLNPSGIIADLLLNTTNSFKFYAPTSLVDELDKHNTKLKKISGLNQEDLNFLKLHILKKVELIDLKGISSFNWLQAIDLTSDVDEFDSPFIALSLELNAPLWTGDKKLIKGLETKGIDWILHTKMVLAIREEI